MKTVIVAAIFVACALVVTPATSMAYDSPTETASFGITPDPSGTNLFLSRMIDPNGHARETYIDHVGRTRTFAEHPSATAGRQLQVGYPDGEVVTNSYDAAGMIHSIGGAGSGWSRTYASDLRYDVFGNRDHALYGNGDVSVWTFDPARIRLTSIATTLASGTPIQALHYSYDPASNPVEIDNNLAPTPVNNTLPGTATQSFSYDGVDRLVHATGAGTLNANKTTTYTQAFTYSASHNILDKTAVHQVITNGTNISLPSDTNYASSYAYAPARPHLPTTVGDLTVARDQTDQYLLTERARSDDAVAHREDILAMVSHDLRDLLSTVALSASAIVDAARADAMGAAQVITAQRIHRAAGRMARLISDLVDVEPSGARKRN